MKKMNHTSKAALLIILIYIFVQFIPLLYAQFISGTVYMYLNIGTFLFGVAAMIFVERWYKMDFHFERSLKDNIKAVLIWGVLGLFLSYIVQIAASLIETLIMGVNPTSVNTTLILEIIMQYPIFLLFVSVLGPIMEEYVFRKAIGGLLVSRIGWIGGAVISSLIFAVIHLDGHYLLYASLGLLFSYLYYKTGHLLAPIIAHVLMNTLVILLYLV